jgi:hypothetical protein
MATSLDAVLAQYEKNTKPTGNGNSMDREDRLKKYFTTILLQGETSGRKRIRILPTPDNSSPFKEVWFHEVQVNKQWLKLYDPGKNENEPSPLNDLYDELMSTGKAQDKELASQYRSRKFYIVKVIDRDAEEDGVKFWRFKHNYKNEGVLDKIIPIWREKGDVTDPSKGRDLIITLTPEGITVREKGRRTTYGPISYGKLLLDGARLYVEAEKRRKAELRKARRLSR